LKLYKSVKELNKYILHHSPTSHFKVKVQTKQRRQEENHWVQIQPHTCTLGLGPVSTDAWIQLIISTQFSFLFLIDEKS